MQENGKQNEINDECNGNVLPDSKIFCSPIIQCDVCRDEKMNLLVNEIVNMNLKELSRKFCYANVEYQLGYNIFPKFHFHLILSSLINLGNLYTKSSYFCIQI